MSGGLYFYTEDPGTLAGFRCGDKVVVNYDNKLIISVVLDAV